MPTVETKNFGTVQYESGTELVFPRGIPGFEQRREFLALHFADTDPLIFLQSVEDGDLCFVTLPVPAVDRDYRLQVEGEDRELVGLPASGALRIGEDVLCVVVLSIGEEGPTANLLAPVVVNLHNRRAVQAVAAQSGYSHQHRLAAEEAVACS